MTVDDPEGSERRDKRTQWGGVQCLSSQSQVETRNTQHGGGGYGHFIHLFNLNRLVCCLSPDDPVISSIPDGEPLIAGFSEPRTVLCGTTNGLHTCSHRPMSRRTAAEPHPFWEGFFGGSILLKGKRLRVTAIDRTEISTMPAGHLAWECSKVWFGGKGVAQRWPSLDGMVENKLQPARRRWPGRSIEAGNIGRGPSIKWVFSLI